MSLIKLSPEIISITGKLGGQFFKKCQDGQHIVAPPRTVKKTPTEKQRDQRAWYSSKKHAEHYPYPDIGFPDDEIPPGTHVIYSLETMWAHRQPSPFVPTVTQVWDEGNIYGNIQHWINIIWQPGWATWGLTKELMFFMTLKWYFVLKYTYGFSAAGSFAGAKVNMLNWISVGAGAVAVPLLSLWVGLIGLGFFFSFLEWLEGYGGSVRFNPGRVIIRKGTEIWFGGLCRRPSAKMYDFAICSPSVFEGSIHKVTPSPSPYKIHWFHLQDLWQTMSKGLIFYYVYNWTTVRCRFRGMGYKLPSNRLRMQVSESQHDYWDKPVGWWQTNAESCAYLDDFDDHFSYWEHPADPL